MGIKAKNLLNAVRTLTVAVNYFDDGKPCEGQIIIHHRVITPELWEQLRSRWQPAVSDVQTPESQTENQDASPPLKSRNDLVEELLYLVTAWDVEGDDGQPLPVNEENLNKIDYLILQAIDRAIIEYTFPKKTT